MNKAEFMRQLECLLENISEQERQEALQYYDDYFSDAGPENEQAVIEALGNPARVAENIKRDLYGAGYGDNLEARKPVTGRELTEYGTVLEESQRQGTEQEADGTWQQESQSYTYQGDTSFETCGQEASSGKKRLSGGMIALIVILCILASPVLLGLGGCAITIAAGVLVILVGAIAVWFCLILCFGIVALICLIMGIVLAILGVAGTGIHPLAGLGIIGGGLLTAGIGILFMMLTVAMAGIVTPAICRGIGHLFTGRKKVA